MSMRTTATLAIAAIFGLVALLMARGYLAAQAHVGSPVTTTPVVVAASPISRGTVLTPNMLKLASYPRQAVPGGAYAEMTELTRNGLPRRALRDMVINEPIVATKVTGPGGATALSADLKGGMRAVSVKSSDVAGVGGFVLPGDRVDVLATRPMDGPERSGSLVVALAENVRVLGVDQASEADKPVVAKAVTLEVTPEQAQAISLAQAVGAVTLALREPTDGRPLARRVMTVADLGEPKAAAKRIAKPRHIVPAPPPERQILITRGVQVTAYALNP